MTSAADGSWEVRSLAPGRHSVVVERDGFKRLVRSGITVTSLEMATVNLTMEIGEVRQTVEVVADADMVDSNSATVSSPKTDCDGRASATLAAATSARARLPRGLCRGCIPHEELLSGAICRLRPKRASFRYSSEERAAKASPIRFIGRNRTWTESGVRPRIDTRAPREVPA